MVLRDARSREARPFQREAQKIANDFRTKTSLFSLAADYDRMMSYVRKQVSLRFEDFYESIDFT
jgi:hypothetical protein